MKYIKDLPFHSVLNDDELECGLWKAEENICEFKGDVLGVCDDSGYYYGTDSEYDPKFCARHFYQKVVIGDGLTNYGLVG